MPAPYTTTSAVTQAPLHEGSRRNTELLLLAAAALPVVLIYAMYVVNTGVELTLETLTVPLALFAAFTIAHIAVRFLAPGADPAIMPITFLLSGIGITFVTRLAPSLAINQVIWLFVSIAAMVATLILVRNLDQLARYKFTIGLIGVILLLLPMLVGVERNGSKLWLMIGPFSFQPGELAKIFIVLFLASYLSDNRELLAASAHHIGPFTIPRFRMLTPLFVMWGLSLLVVVFERDLGSALLFFTIFVVMLYVATGRISYVVIACALLAAGGYACYRLFAHVRVRFDIWLDPFADPSGSGMQIVQSLYSLADGGLIGTGIGKGMPTLIPVVESDFIFSAIGEEMGLLGGSAVLIAFMLLAVRAFATAARAKSDMAAFTAVGLITSLSFQAFIIVGGVTRLIPMTGITLPFMSQGGSSLLSSFIIIGLLLRAGDQATGRDTEIVGTGVSARDSAQQDPIASRIIRGSHARGRFGLLTAESGVLGRVALSKRLTALISLFTLLFAILVGNLTYIQVISAQELRDRPNNNHTIARSAYVQRGSIISIDGITLAESIQQEDGSFVRTYPAGQLAAHTVGYLSVQYGSTGVENSMNDTLTGHADFSNWQNALFSLAGVQTPGDSVVLTINSEMQAACEAALAGRVGSIVVLNPSTGAVLAKASSPTFSYDQIGEIIQGNSESGALVDRSTQGLYAPGSTFKVVSLAAALDAGYSQLDTVYEAPAEMTIGGGNVSNDKMRDFGELTLKEALVQSANTVYGQVGSLIGPETLVNYARAFGYGGALGQDFPVVASLMPSPQEMTEWETAWAACGQPVGDHESPVGPQTTVMQNAVIAAAIANDGMALDPYIIDHILSPEGVTISTTRSRTIGQPIAPETAREVKESMLEVVQSGTGWAAGVSGVQVAGKTGTAQVGNGDINSLFIGFAPYEQPTLAIAVCVEGQGEDVEGLAAALAGQVFASCLEVQARGVS